MSGGEIETTRAAIEAFNRRDGASFDALLAADPEIVPVRSALEGTVYRGPAAGSEYCAAVDESWENLTWELEEVREGEGWALALGRIHGSGRGSGATIDARGGWLVRFEHGLITSFRTYPDRAQALRDMGLSE
jgi:ketosteroid isomerase-like protein